MSSPGRPARRGLGSAPAAVRVACLAAALAAAGCAPAAVPADAVVSHEVPSGAPDPGPPTPTLVAARPGLANVRPHSFESATLLADGRTLRLAFWGGVAPCFGLDRVEVAEAPDAVTATLFTGSDPSSPDAVCIEIAVYLAVDVALASPLAGRPLRDGALRDAPPSGDAASRP